jgi:hypothetical protein
VQEIYERTLNYATVHYNHILIHNIKTQRRHLSSSRPPRGYRRCSRCSCRLQGFHDKSSNACVKEEGEVGTFSGSREKARQQPPQRRQGHLSHAYQEAPLLSHFPAPVLSSHTPIKYDRESNALAASQRLDRHVIYSLLKPLLYRS